MAFGGNTIGASPKPKAQPVVGVLLFCLDALLVAGLLTFAAPCGHLESAEPSCLWASRATLGIAAVIAILSIVRVFETDEGERRGLSLACALLGLLVASMPDLVIGLCADPTMPCNAIMRPFAMCIGIGIGAVGGVDLTRRLLSLRTK